MKRAKAALGGYYFFYFAAQACMANALNVYLTSAAGLTPGQKGAFHGLTGVAAGVMLPLVGIWADRRGGRRLLPGALLGLTVAAWGLGGQRSFLPILLWGLGWEVGRSSAVALADRLASGQTGRGYGGIRSLGSLGYLAGGAGLGWLSGIWGVERLLFPLYLLLMIPALLLSMFWPEKQTAARGISLKESAGLLKERWFWLSAAMGVLGSVGVSGLQPWVGELLLNGLGAPAATLGWNSLMCVAGEVIALPLLSRVLIPKWGYSRCFRLTGLALMLRCLLYALAPNPGLVLGAGLLYGLSVGAYTALNLSFVASHAPENSRSTAVLTIAALSALGRAVAGWAFGSLSQGLGLGSIFWAMTGVAAVATLLPYSASSSSTGQ